MKQLFVFCFLQCLAAEKHGCGAVWWFVTSEATLTTGVCILELQIISTKLKATDTVCDTCLIREMPGSFVHFSNSTQLLPYLTTSSFSISVSLRIDEQSNL